MFFLSFTRQTAWLLPCLRLWCSIFWYFQLLLMTIFRDTAEFSPLPRIEFLSSPPTLCRNLLYIQKNCADLGTHMILVITKFITDKPSIYPYTLRFIHIKNNILCYSEILIYLPLIWPTFCTIDKLWVQVHVGLRGFWRIKTSNHPPRTPNPRESIKTAK